MCLAFHLSTRARFVPRYGVRARLFQLFLARRCLIRATPAATLSSLELGRWELRTKMCWPGLADLNSPALAGLSLPNPSTGFSRQAAVFGVARLGGDVTDSLEVSSVPRVRRQMIAYGVGAE